MVNNMHLKPEAFVYKKRRRLERNILLKSKRKKFFRLIISLGLITITSFLLTPLVFVIFDSQFLHARYSPRSIMDSWERVQ